MEQNSASWSDWLVLKSWHDKHLDLLKSQGDTHNLKSVSTMTDRNSKSTKEDKKKMVFRVSMEFIRQSLSALH